MWFAFFHRFCETFLRSIWVCTVQGLCSRILLFVGQNRKEQERKNWKWNKMWRNLKEFCTIHPRVLAFFPLVSPSTLSYSLSPTQQSPITPIGRDKMKEYVYSGPRKKGKLRKGVGMFTEMKILYHFFHITVPLSLFSIRGIRRRKK